MSDRKLRLLFEVEREIDSVTFNGTFLAIGTPLENPARAVLFVNGSEVAVKISLNGTDNNFTLLAGAAFVLDAQSNSVSDSNFVIAAQTQFYVKGSASTGTVTVSPIYAF